MSLLPAFVPPSRPRGDVAPATTPERRAPELSQRGFADSLAAARADDARAAADDAATSRARQAAQQRSQVQSLMLSGAMKFAVTRSDGHTCGTKLEGQVVSLPATPADDAGTAADDGDDVIAELLPDAPPEIPAHIRYAAQHDGVIEAPAASVTAMQGEGMTTSVAPVTPERTEPGDVTVASVNAPGADATPLAATAAALQLIAVLPIPDVVVSLPDAPEPAAGEARTDGTAVATARFTGTPLSAPDVPLSTGATPLVEDHFDAPAAAIAPAASAAPQTATPLPTQRSASTDASVPATDAPEIDPRRPTATTTTGTGAAAAAAARRLDRTAIERDVARLDPEFRERLERVMQRMRTEFGHEVTVVETVRSQARQNALFAQGRTAPGPVVTWTKNSRHGKGLAADLMVDGAWQHPEGYAHLAEVAKQEGLRTLGARDPGHVELPTEGAVSGETLGTLLGDLQGEAGDGARQLRADVRPNADGEARNAAVARIANVAQVARVASVAAVAKVAEVADVARPGAGAREAVSAGESSAPLAVTGAVPSAGSTDLAGSVRVTAPVANVNMADRISHLLDLQATQAARPLSSVLLRMENATGIDDQIRIDTRGTSVDARLGLGNAQQAAALTDRLGELREALERRGLTADGVRVQAAAGPRATDSVSFTRATAPVLEMAAMRAAADSQAQGNLRDQSAREQQQREALAREQSRHTPRSSSDDARHRSRREQPEDRR
jgi:uncharacterized protein YcbK (DUF882 family)